MRKIGIMITRKSIDIKFLCLNMRKSLNRRKCHIVSFCVLIFSIINLSPFPSGSLAAGVDSGINVVVNDLIFIDFTDDINEVYIGSEEILEIKPKDKKKFVIYGIKPGTTRVIFTNEKGYNKEVKVNVREDDTNKIFIQKGPEKQELLSQCDIRCVKISTDNSSTKSGQSDKSNFSTELLK
jgi:Flp pilus assembly secretin CpaC